MQPIDDDPQFATLKSIFEAALARIDPHGMIKERMRLEGDRLTVALESGRWEADLARYSRVLVLGCGKASARMAKAVEEILAGRPGLEWGGLVCTKYGHTERLARIEQAEAGHPVPDEAGVAAAARIAELARGADERTLVINLISGGGSALLPAPMPVRAARSSHTPEPKLLTSLTSIMMGAVCGRARMAATSSFDCDFLCTRAQVMRSTAAPGSCSTRTHPAPLAATALPPSPLAAASTSHTASISPWSGAPWSRICSMTANTELTPWAAREMLSALCASVPAWSFLRKLSTLWVNWLAASNPGMNPVTPLMVCRGRARTSMPWATSPAPRSSSPSSTCG